MRVSKTRDRARSRLPYGPTDLPCLPSVSYISRSLPCLEVSCIDFSGMERVMDVLDGGNRRERVVDGEDEKSL